MTDGLVAALARCQAKFPPIVKSQTATVPTKSGGQYSYAYADTADVLAAVRPVLAAEGIVVSQYTEITELDGVVLITTLMYSLDEGMSSRFPLHIAGLNAQGVGSLMTYHRRYQLCALLGVHPVGDDDDGNLAATAQTYARRPVEGEGAASRLGNTANPAAPSRPEPLPQVAISQPEKPLAAMTMRELIDFARENSITVSGSKTEIVRILEPLVRAASGEEPFFDNDAVPPQNDAYTKGNSTKLDPEQVPFEPKLAPSVADEFRNLPPKVRDSVRRGNDE